MRKSVKLGANPLSVMPATIATSDMMMCLRRPSRSASGDSAAAPMPMPRVPIEATRPCSPSPRLKYLVSADRVNDVTRIS